MRSTAIEEWFDCNESLFESLDKCRKYFNLIEGEITEFKFMCDDLIIRFDFTVINSLSYKKTKQITITLDKTNGTLGTYYQKEVE